MKRLLSIEEADLDRLADLVAARVKREVAEILRSEPESGELFTVAEVAVRFSVSERTIRRAITSGDLSAERIGRGVRISRQHLDAWKSRRPKAGRTMAGTYQNPMEGA